MLPVQLGVGVKKGVVGQRVRAERGIHRGHDLPGAALVQCVKREGRVGFVKIFVPVAHELAEHRTIVHIVAVDQPVGRRRVSADAPTANWLIYGHNMHDGSMFGQLVRYRDEDFYKAHPTFTFDTLYEGGTWQVVAAVDTALGADTLPYYTFFDADTKLDWQHRVRAITEKALYDTGVMPEYGAQLLTLSTCGDTRPDTDARFALLAVRID